MNVVIIFKYGKRFRFAPSFNNGLLIENHGQGTHNDKMCADSLIGNYGNTGCGVFKEGVQN
jgi:hypothetical protein